MGLDAHVFCNCLRERRVKSTPPVAIESIYIDEEEGVLELCYPQDLDERQRSDLWWQVDRWAENCCEHKNMHLCAVRVGNWAAVRELQEALHTCGCSELADIWPQVNGGWVDAALAPQLLEQLDGFCCMVSALRGTFLADAAMGATVYSYIAGYDGVFSMDGRAGLDVGLDPEGLFVRERATKRELFRALHVRQLPLPEEQGEGPRGTFTARPVCLVDVASGRSQKIYARIGLDNGPEELRVLERPLCAADFYAVAPLRKLLEASVATGNPIYWT